MPISSPSARPPATSSGKRTWAAPRATSTRAARLLPTERSSLVSPGASATATTPVTSWRSMPRPGASYGERRPWPGRANGAATRGGTCRSCFAPDPTPGSRVATTLDPRPSSSAPHRPSRGHERCAAPTGQPSIRTRRWRSTRSRASSSGTSSTCRASLTTWTRCSSGSWSTTTTVSRSSPWARSRSSGSSTATPVSSGPPMTSAIRRWSTSTRCRDMPSTGKG